MRLKSKLVHLEGKSLAARQRDGQKSDIGISGTTPSLASGQNLGSATKIFTSMNSLPDVRITKSRAMGKSARKDIVSSYGHNQSSPNQNMKKNGSVSSYVNEPTHPSYAVDYVLSAEAD